MLFLHDNMMSSSDLRLLASPTFCVPQPPKALRNVADLPTPKLKTVPLYTIANRVISSHASVGLKCDETSDQGKKQAPKGITKRKPILYMCTCSVILFSCVHVHIHLPYDCHYYFVFFIYIASKSAQVQCFVCGVITFKPCNHSVLCGMCAKVARSAEL